MPPPLILILRRLLHYAFQVFGGVVIVMSLVALALKFWIMPDVDRYRPDLEAAASRAAGVPVRIGALEADWLGIHPRLLLRDVRLQPASGDPLLLPRVEAIGSWWSLAVLEPRLRQLTLEGPRFFLRRAPDGVIHLAGIALNGPGAPSPFPDWLLRQGRIVIKDAQVVWLDEQLAAPPLALSGVRLLLENRFGRHRFGGVAWPSDAAARLDLRGDLRGRSVHHPAGWSGLLFAQVAGARFATWGQWVPWAQEAVRGGRGDLRFWLTLDQGQPRGLTGDARLDEVALRMGRDLPELRFDSLAGRIGWARGQTDHTFYVERLRFRTPNGAPSEPANLRVNLTPDGASGFKRIAAEAANLRLEALTALASALPLPRRGHDLIDALAPRGLVESARGHWAGPGDYALNLRMRQGGWRAHGPLPGLQGLDFQVQADQNGGQGQVQGRDLRLDWPSLFRHELGFSQVEARADWQERDDGLRLAFQADRLLNADLEGEASGHIRLPARGAPEVDISARLERGEANAVYRYLPHKVAEDAYAWLKRGLVSGHAEDVRLRLRGSLDRFPFHAGGGEFLVGMRMVDGVLDYAPGWPRIEGVHGQLLFQGQGMRLTADRGNILDARLGPVKVDIPDLHSSEDEIVRVDGHARGEMNTFLDFIRQSPVLRYTEGFTEHFQARGPGVLALKLNLPVRRMDSTTVGGALGFQNNTLAPGKGLPELSHIQGAITFTEKTLQGKGIQMRVLDMPAQLDLNTQPGVGLGVRLQGTASAEDLRPHLPQALAGLMRGSARWQAGFNVNAAGQASGLALNSDMAGLSLALPAPLGKSAAHPVPLSLSYEPDVAGEGRLLARYGNLARLHALFPRNSQARVNLHLGTGEPALPREAGLWISGNLRHVDLDAWRGLDWSGLTQAQTAPAQGLAFRQAALSFGEVRLFNRRLHETHARLQPSGKGWNLEVAGREVNGTLVTVQEAGGTRVLAQFKRLALPAPEAAPPQATQPPTPADAQRLTNLELNIQSLAWKDMELGELRLRLSPVKTGYQVDHFRLSPAEGRLEGSGLVSGHPRRPSRMKLQLSSTNLGKLLARLGHADALKGGEGEISGQLGWTGGVEDFDIGTLDGDLDIRARGGQFLKVDPGAGRLVGVLSLQALPRRISLDFRDVFSQGFAFDEIAGQIHIERGSAYTRDLRIDGPAAKVRMSGVVNLDKETQNLNVRIQPRLEDTVAVAGAILGGPAVGLGTLLASKVLKNPIGQAMGFEYTVSGSWEEPLIVKVPRNPPAEAGEAAP